jgi:hypothetical protein
MPADPRERTIPHHGVPFKRYAGPFTDGIEAHDYLANMVGRGGRPTLMRRSFCTTACICGYRRRRSAKRGSSPNATTRVTHCADVTFFYCRIP